MEIGLMRSRITIQKNTITVDAIGNHINTWTDYYSCSAYANLKTGSEYTSAGQMISTDSLVFSVRWCIPLKDLDPDHFRILFDGAIYNITSVDDYQFRHRTWKITAERVKR